MLVYWFRVLRLSGHGLPIKQKETIMSKRKLNILVLSIYRDLAEDFVLSGVGDLKEATQIDEHLVAFNIFAGDPSQDPTFDTLLKDADAMVLIARFLDVLSLDKIKAIYRHLPDSLDIPFSICFLRDKDEADFKISCPSCGQKLWLRDTDINKRGRCPNCKKPFVIMSQPAHLKAQLMLPETVILTQVVRNEQETFQRALRRLLEPLAQGIKPTDTAVNAEAAKNATVRIQIQDS